MQNTQPKVVNSKFEMPALEMPAQTKSDSPRTRHLILRLAAGMLSAVLAPSLLCVLLFVGSKQAFAKDDSLVGKKMPKLYAKKWINSKKYHPSDLAGKAWILVIGRVEDKNFSRIAPLLNSIHSKDSNSGPFAFYYTKEQEKQLDKVLSKSTVSFNFPILTIHTATHYRKLDKGIYPYFYMVEPNGIVSWQGDAGEGEFQDRIRSFKSKHKGNGGSGSGLGKSPEKKPTPKGPTQPEKAKPKKKEVVKLPKDYKKSVNRALRGSNNAKRWQLLSLSLDFHDHRDGDQYKAEEPADPLAKKLWKKLDKEINSLCTKAEKALKRSSTRIGKLSNQVRKLNSEIRPFPPAKKLRSIYLKMAAQDGESRFNQAVVASESQEVKAAIKHLRYIISHYPQTPVAEKAQTMLNKLAQ